MRLARLQSWVAAATIVCAALGLFSSFGCRVIPKGDPAMAWVAHPILLLLGGAGGLATVLRQREIDRRRWAIVQEPLITSGEVEYAHKEAERERRVAATWFMAAPVALGYWMAYQFNLEDRISAADFLAVSPLLGYVVGLVIGQRRNPEAKG